MGSMATAMAIDQSSARSANVRPGPVLVPQNTHASGISGATTEITVNFDTTDTAVPMSSELIEDELRKSGDQLAELDAAAAAKSSTRGQTQISAAETHVNSLAANMKLLRQQKDNEEKDEKSYYECLCCDCNSTCRPFSSCTKCKGDRHCCCTRSRPSRKLQSCICGGRQSGIRVECMESSTQSYAWCGLWFLIAVFAAIFITTVILAVQHSKH